MSNQIRTPVAVLGTEPSIGTIIYRADGPIILTERGWEMITFENGYEILCQDWEDQVARNQEKEQTA